MGDDPPQSGHMAVPKLVRLYAELVDNGDCAGVGELFADAVDGTLCARHVTTKLMLDADDAEGASLLLRPILSGRYHETFQRRGGERRFARRRRTNEYLGDPSRHLVHEFAGRRVTDSPVEGTTRGR